jgi:hypothetical protein
MGYNQIKDKVRERVSESNINTAMNPSGAAAEIFNLGDGVVRAIQDLFENLQSSCGTLQVNVLVLALKMFADDGNEEAIALLHSVAGGKMKSLSLLGKQGNADIALRIATEYEKNNNAELTSLPKPEQENVRDNYEESGDKAKYSLRNLMRGIARLFGNPNSTNEEGNTVPGKVHRSFEYGILVEQNEVSSTNELIPHLKTYLHELPISDEQLICGKLEWLAKQWETSSYKGNAKKMESILVKCFNLDLRTWGGGFCMWLNSGEALTGNCNEFEGVAPYLDIQCGKGYHKVGRFAHNKYIAVLHA